MKRQLFTYILAAFCATAILSCNKEAANDSIAPDDECTVLLSASIDESTKAVSIDEGKVVSSWAIGDTLTLIRDSDSKIISKLYVISVNGNEAQLSGKVRGSYEIKDTDLTLYYGDNAYNYDYSGQTGTVQSAVSKAYLKAATQIDSLVGKTFYLHDAVMEHQQSYMGLSFYRGGTPLKVKRVTIKEGGKFIVKTHPLGGGETYYGDDHFIVESPDNYGQEVFYFALKDTAVVNTHDYELEITTVIDPSTDPITTKVYKGTASVPGPTGNYFADAKILLERVSPVITAPTVYPAINHDGLPHNLVIPAVLQPGAIAEYGVSTIPEMLPTVWSTSIPTRTETGSYTIWYRVDGGDYYDDILETMVGTTFIKPTSNVTIVLPTPAATHIYNGNPYDLLTSPASVQVDGSPIIATVEYFVRKDSAVPPTGDEETGWSSAYPPQRTDPGVYYIWCRYLGDSSLGYLPAMAGPVSVTINKISITLTAADQTVAQGGSIAQYVDDNTKVSFSTPVLGIHTFTVNLTADTSLVGTSPIVPSITIYDSGSTDVTNTYYIITPVNGTLTVTP